MVQPTPPTTNHRLPEKLSCQPADQWPLQHVHPRPGLKRKAGMAATSRSGGRLSGWETGLTYSTYGAYCPQRAVVVWCLSAQQGTFNTGPCRGPHAGVNRAITSVSPSAAGTGSCSRSGSNGGGGGSVPSTSIMTGPSLYPVVSRCPPAVAWNLSCGISSSIRYPFVTVAVAKRESPVQSNQSLSHGRGICLSWTPSEILL